MCLCFFYTLFSRRLANDFFVTQCSNICRVVIFIVIHTSVHVTYINLIDMFHISFYVIFF